MAYIHAKRKRPSQGNASARTAEVVFKWVSVKGIRLSAEENRRVYEEYKQLRHNLLRDTVYNPDGTENVEGISRLRQAGLSDKAIFETIASGRTPNGYNYHHLFPRALSGSFKDGVAIGDEKLTTIHDWRCMQPLPNATHCDIHGNVHAAMDERNGELPGRPGTKVMYDIAMPLSAKEYEMYKQNPQSVKAELLIVTPTSYKTVDQRDKGGNALAMAAMKAKAATR